MGTHTKSNADYFNRELSWISFNRRVLEQGLDTRKPLLDRLKFLAIVSSNFDEFFMVRVASVKRQYLNGNYVTCPSGMSPAAQLKEIRRQVRDMLRDQYDCLLHDLFPRIAERGIVYRSAQDYTENQKATLKAYFSREIFPLLTPVRFDPGEAFINFSNLKIHVAFKLRKLGEADQAANLEGEVPPSRIAIVQIPSSVPRIVSLPESSDAYGFTTLEQIIWAWGRDLFPGYEVEETLVFRLIRDADFSVDEYREDDFVEAMERVLHNRDRSSVVRMTVSGQSEEILGRLKTLLKLEDSDVYELPMPLDPSVFMEIAGLKGYDHLREEAWKPVENLAFAEDGSIWDAIKKRDILLNLPYESFSPVVRMVREASEDPQVLAIKMTLYRTSGDSPIVQALETAARNGKHVTVMVEIKARFDEQRNIEWSERLSEAGGIVVFGIVGLKVHAKALLVVRREDQGIKRYLHVSTGNYNDRTARLYSDLCLFTARDDFAYEAGLFFNAITGYSVIPVLNKLSMAPHSLKPRLLSLIDREVERHTEENPGVIMAKLNALVDVEVIDALYRASQSGVRIFLNIRGICMLVPGKPGLSEGIRVTSIVDRYLEHTRAVFFKNGGKEEIYLSSADWMPRNLEGRVELMFPVEDPELRDQVKAMLKLYAADNTQSWELQADGIYRKVQVEAGHGTVSSQAGLYRLVKQQNYQRKVADKKEFTIRKKLAKGLEEG